MKKKGQTLFFINPPRLCGEATVAGPKEGQGPLGQEFDIVYEDNRAGEDSFEKAERKMMIDAALLAMQKASLQQNRIDFFLAGDLLNQNISATFAARELGIPFFGVNAACATFASALALGAVLIDGGYANSVLAATASHFCGAERQYRFPTEYGDQRPGTAQWTATGAGAVVLGKETGDILLHSVTVGKVQDLGVKDPFNMGTAMAPAAADTIINHLNDTGFQPDYYDLIVTGDLGNVGKEINLKLLAKAGYNLEGLYNDCGSLLYDSTQETGSGGSGSACSALVLLGHLFKKMRAGNLKKILVVPTGSLHSPTTYMQGETIPCIAHAVQLEMLQAGGE